MCNKYNPGDRVMYVGERVRVTGHDPRITYRVIAFHNLWGETGNKWVIVADGKVGETSLSSYDETPRVFLLENIEPVD